VFDWNGMLDFAFTLSQSSGIAIWKVRIYTGGKPASKRVRH